MSDTNPTAFVVMAGTNPVASAISLKAAQAEAYSRESQYFAEGESRWDEYGADSWRLMRRRTGRGRFSWTQYWVAAVPAIAEDGESR